ncbi:MAG: histidinol dehydrogenase [Gammaproteobacteria bacterium]|nr:histidinol dehydrogenase [Gammaproteobacteria bacterium]
MTTSRRLDSSAPDFDARLSALLDRQGQTGSGVEAAVAEIVAAVRERGDEALLDYTQRFDELSVAEPAQLEMPKERLDQALREIPEHQRTALEHAAERIRDYHQRQRQDSWQYQDSEGNTLGQLVRPLDRVGLYVPGGKAAYPSTVLMTAIPARVAGVAELVMTVPTPRGETNELVLAAAALAGVDRVFTVGGAQAVAALAWGTATIPAVDKVVGPGNIYVATAKRMVFGQVGIDMIAGPSEVAILADGSAPAEWAAMDLFAQAEHDELAQSILLSPDPACLDAVAEAIARLLPGRQRAEIIARSWTGHGALIRVRDLEEGIDIVNRIAPEHLELLVADPEPLLPRVRHAGAIFAGRWSAEALGDYCAGPNHTLPTAGTARFSSPLGVYDFQKRTSLIACTETGAAPLAATAATLAQAEELEAHACSAGYRMGKKP